jgi:hypothetical protein
MAGQDPGIGNAVAGARANPNNPNLASAATEAQKAADMLSHKLVVVNASAESDFDPASRRSFSSGSSRCSSRWIPSSPTARKNRCARSPARVAVDLRIAGVRRRRRLDELWNQHHRRKSPAWRVHRPGSQRHQAGRSASHAIDTSKRPRRSASRCPPRSFYAPTR